MSYEYEIHLENKLSETAKTNLRKMTFDNQKSYFWGFNHHVYCGESNQNHTLKTTNAIDKVTCKRCLQCIKADRNS